MDPAIARTPSRAIVFEDGLGRRHHTSDAGGQPLEVLTLSEELTAVPSFEFALRERASRLAGFRHASYGHVRGVDKAGSTLAVVSDRVPGVRLSEMLTVAEQQLLPVEIDAALCLVRQLVQAVALLHEQVPDVCHGALAPERIVITSNARLVIVEHVLGAALGQLLYPRERYWKDLRIATPPRAGSPRFDRRADVTQLGAVSLALILGRPLSDDDYPGRVGEIVERVGAVSATGGLEPLPEGMRPWLFRALQLDPRASFASAVEARTELDGVLRNADYTVAPSALEAFLAQYEGCLGTDGTPFAMPPAPAPAMTSPGAGRGHVVQPEKTPAVQPSQAPAPIPAAPPAPAAKAAPAAPARHASGTHTPATHTPAPHVTPTQAPASHVSASRVSASHPPVSHAPMSHPAAGHAPVIPAGVSRAPASRAPAAPRVDPTTFKLSGPAEAPLRSPLEDVEVDMPANAAAPSRRWVAAVAAIVILSGGALAARYYLMPPAAEETGTLVVNTNPSGVAVVIDGSPRGATPLAATLAPGAHLLELVVSDSERRKIPVTITAGGQVSQFIEMPKAVAELGTLIVRSDPSGAKVTVDGHVFGRAPLTLENLTPGSHAVTLENDLGEVKETVTIEAGVTAALVVPMSAPSNAPVSGWIAVNAPADVQIFENGRLLGSSQSDRIMVSVGRHQLEFVNEALGYRATQAVAVSPGQTSTIRPEWPKGALALNALPWADVFIDGKLVGETPIGNVAVPIGPHEILFRHPDLGEHQVTHTVTLGAAARLSVDLRKK
ncbi:MAG: PEGA domain-containing protein [Vicinamibacterales bacterium]